jgi:long-chain fatty acid transport protein
MGELQWQNWSVFDAISVRSPALGINGATPENYDDAFYVAVGGEYDFTDDLTVRLGAAWDQTPTSSGVPAPFPAGSWRDEPDGACARRRPDLALCRGKL